MLSLTLLLLAALVVVVSASALWFVILRLAASLAATQTEDLRNQVQNLRRELEMAHIDRDLARSDVALLVRILDKKGPSNDAD